MPIGETMPSHHSVTLLEREATMISSLRLLLPGVFVVLVLAATTWADDFEIALTVALGEKKLEPKDTREAPGEKAVPSRPVFHARAGERLKVNWRATNTHRSAELTDVYVHFFVVEQEKAGQEKVPALDAEANVRHEGALTMDFKPAEKATGAFTLRIDKPGTYLVRVETLYLTDQHGHEHYTALDVVIE